MWNKACSWTVFFIFTSKVNKPKSNIFLKPFFSLLKNSNNMGNYDIRTIKQSSTMFLFCKKNWIIGEVESILAHVTSQVFKFLKDN